MPTDWTKDDYSVLARALVDKDRQMLTTWAGQDGPYVGRWHTIPHRQPCLGCKVEDIIQPPERMDTD